MKIEELKLNIIPFIKEAGTILKENLFKEKGIEHKTNLELVTKMDKFTEDFLFKKLSNLYPEIGFLSEEGTDISGTTSLRWILDPLDGTTNYSKGIPWFNISLALEDKGAIISAVVYNPCNEELFYAALGEGSYLNGAKCCISKEKEIENSIIATGFPYYYKENEGKIFQNHRNMSMKTLGLRRFGSAALDLSYVACGRYDGFFEEGLKPWDLAAGKLLITEAGGTITNYKGNELNIFKDKNCIASNGLIHQKMRDILDN